MKEFSGVGEIKEPFKKSVVTIGNFDGVHLGHQELLSRAIEKSKELDAPSIAITFDPHPLKSIRPDNPPSLITIHSQKKKLIEENGIENLLTICFSSEFANLGAIEFIEDILIKKLNAKAVIVGRDYMFGKNRQGNIDLLAEYGKKYDYELILPEWIKFQGERISSTLVRKAVMDGKLDHAKSMLGRFYRINGEVIHGRDRGGKKLGFPTANIELADELCPKTGVYAVKVFLENQMYQGVANIGYSPTFDDHKFTVEVHILDFDEDIYGKKIRVDFVERLRGEVKFSGLNQLSAQIKEDALMARKILSEN